MEYDVLEDVWYRGAAFMEVLMVKRLMLMSNSGLQCMNNSNEYSNSMCRMRRNRVQQGYEYITHSIPCYVGIGKSVPQIGIRVTCTRPLSPVAM